MNLDDIRPSVVLAFVGGGPQPAVMAEMRVDAVVTAESANGADGVLGCA